MRAAGSWFLMFLLAVAIVIIGIEGALGKVLAITFCPDFVEVY